MLIAILICIFSASWLLGYAECISKGLTPKQSVKKSLLVNIAFYAAFFATTAILLVG